MGGHTLHGLRRPVRPSPLSNPPVWQAEDIRLPINIDTDWRARG